MGQGRSRMVDLLELVTSATPAEPALGRDAHPEVRRMLQVRRLFCAAFTVGWIKYPLCALMNQGADQPHFLRRLHVRCVLAAGQPAVSHTLCPTCTYTMLCTP